MTFKTVEQKEKKVQHINKILQELKARSERIGELIDIYEIELEEAYGGEIIADLEAKRGIINLAETRT